MMQATLGLAVLLTQATLGGLGHHRPAAGCCDACGVVTAEIQVQIHRLQHCPRWRDRDDAAGELRHFDWRCHPEIVAALVTSMLLDCHEEVREESAESLAKLAPCVPEAHAALAKAARCDPDHATRKWARRGLKRLDHKCEVACAICGPAIVAAPAPVPTRVVYPVPGPVYGDPAVVEPAVPSAYDGPFDAPRPVAPRSYAAPAPPSVPSSAADELEEPVLRSTPTLPDPSTPSPFVLPERVEPPLDGPALEPPTREGRKPEPRTRRTRLTGLFGLLGRDGG